MPTQQRLDITKAPVTVTGASVLGSVGPELVEGLSTHGSTSSPRTDSVNRYRQLKDLVNDSVFFRTYAVGIRE